MASSEDGWQPPRLDPTSSLLAWKVVPGTDPPVHLQIMVGWPTALLLAFAADLNAFVERMRDDDSACYTPTNTVDTSNHLNGTAFDFNWDSHPFHDFGTFNDAQMQTLAELFDFYTIGDLKVIAWGGKDWGGNPQDEMHFQCGYDTYQNPLTLKFIDTFIRPDGFSTFRRGPMSSAVDVLFRAVDVSMEQAARILPTVTSGLNASQCNTVNRVAMWLAQCGEESAGFSTTEEFASGAEYEGRCDDLGNCSPGDGVKYKGRTWIQITGKSHYAEFSRWAFDKGFVTSPTQFVDDPTSLGDLRWAGIGAAWYWTVARPDINALSDTGDVVTVTHRINGGDHGLADRQARYDRAHALGDQLLSLTTAAPQQPSGEDDWLTMPSNQEKLDAIYNALFTPQPPENIYRDANDPGITPIDAIRAILSMVYEGTVERGALEGEQASIDKVVRTAKGLAVEQRDWAITRANLVWDLGRAGGTTPPPPSPRPQSSAEPVVQQVIPSEPEVLPALPAATPAAPNQVDYGSMPNDLLTVLDKLDVFNRSYRERFAQLTKTDNTEKESK